MGFSQKPSKIQWPTFEILHYPHPSHSLRRGSGTRPIAYVRVHEQCRIHRPTSYMALHRATACVLYAQCAIKSWLSCFHVVVVVFFPPTACCLEDVLQRLSSGCKLQRLHCHEGRVWILNKCSKAQRMLWRTDSQSPWQLSSAGRSLSMVLKTTVGCSE